MIKIKAADKKQNIEITEIKLKSLVKNKPKEDIWTLSGESIINVKYHIYEDKRVRQQDRAITYNPKISVPDLSSIIRLEQIKPSIESPQKAKLVKKLSFMVPNTFKGRDKKKLFTSKNLLQMDLLRSSILGNKKEESTDTNSLNNSLLQLTRLEYDTIDLDLGEVFEADTFTDVFFICGLTKKNAKVISDSEDLEPPCKHKQCGILRSYRPDILHRYPELNYKDLNLCSSTSSFCFPNGIKICYSKFEEDLEVRPPFFTLITNEYGKRFYMTIMQYYIKMEYIQFKKEYDFDPVTEYFQFGKLMDEVDSMSHQETNKREKNDQIVFSFSDNDYIYLPFAACMISSYPYIKQMEKCLETIIHMSVDDCLTTDEINKMIMHFIYEIPIPPPNRKLLFYLPYSSSPLEIYGTTYKDLPLLSNDLSIIFNKFSVENILLIHIMMLFEQRILFVTDNYKELTEISQGFVNLLYPLQWTHIYVPILTEDTYKYVLAFMPYIMGVDESLLGLIRGQLDDNSEESNSVYIIHIKRNYIEYYDKQNKRNRKSILVEVPDYPEKIYDFLIKELKEIKKIVEKGKEFSTYNTQKINKKLRVLFMKSFVSLFGDYKKYVSILHGLPLLNVDSFLETKNHEYKKFYSELVGTQIFGNFLQQKETFPYFEKMCLRYNNLPVVTRHQSTKKIRSNSLSRSNTNLIRMNTMKMNKTPGNKRDGSNASSDEEVDTKYDSLDTYIIYPNFIGSEIFTKVDITKIEEYITSRFKCIYY
jgi:hypothetical protein